MRVQSSETCQKFTSTVIAYVNEIQSVFLEILFAKAFEGVLDLLWKVQYFDFFAWNL